MVMQLSIDELLKKCPSVYGLALTASRRAKEIAEGAPRLIETDARKATSVALEEIARDKIIVTVLPTASTGEPSTKRRGSKSKKKEEKD